MDNEVKRQRDAFLADASRRASGRFRGTDFSRAINFLISWSDDTSRGLDARTPGAQRTVAFGPGGKRSVLWAAYPRLGDGAKISVLPGRFRQLSTSDRNTLIAQSDLIAPEARAGRSGKLELPLFNFSSDPALKGLGVLLDLARVHVG